jgi:transcriptional regulator with XRE-family HTH domain
MLPTQGARSFNAWLRGQLKVRRMSQRQLAQRAGVNHSTISRLVRGNRAPSLGTALKLARGLRALESAADAASAGDPRDPTARVEQALRADTRLSEAQVRQVVEYYRAVRRGRLGQPAGRAPEPGARTEPGASRTNPRAEPTARATPDGWRGTDSLALDRTRVADERMEPDAVPPRAGTFVPAIVEAGAVRKR